MRTLWAQSGTPVTSIIPDHNTTRFQKIIVHNGLQVTTSVLMAGRDSSTEIVTATRTDFVATFLPETAQVALLRRQVTGDDERDGPVTVQTMIIGVNHVTSAPHGRWSEQYVTYNTHAGNFCHIQPVLSDDEKYCLFDLRLETDPFSKKTQLVLWNIKNNSHKRVKEGRISSCSFLPTNDQSMVEFLYAEAQNHNGHAQIFKGIMTVQADRTSFELPDEPMSRTWGDYLRAVRYTDNGDGLLCPTTAVLSYTREWKFYIWQCATGISETISFQIPEDVKEEITPMCHSDRQPLMVLSPCNTFAAVVQWMTSEESSGRVILLKLNLCNGPGSNQGIQFVGIVPKGISETDHPVNFVLCFSPDDKYLATSGSSDGSLDIWLLSNFDSPEYQNKKQLPVASLPANDIKFKSGKWISNSKLVVVYTKKTVSLWLGTFYVHCSDDKIRLVECGEVQLCTDDSLETGPNFFDTAVLRSQSCQWIAVTGTDVGVFVSEDTPRPRRIDCVTPP